MVARTKRMLNCMLLEVGRVMLLVLRDIVAELLMSCGWAFDEKQKHGTLQRSSRLIYPVLAALISCVTASIPGSPSFAMPKPAMIFVRLP